MKHRVSDNVARWRKAAYYERIAFRRKAPLVEGQVLYEAFSGSGMLDNPEAIFTRLLNAPDQQHLRHVWALRDPGTDPGAARYRYDPRVRFVTHGSDGYHEALARSQYLVNNATFPPEFGKREGQVYLNTWHGTPLKQMGYDIPGGGPATRNIVRNFVSADFLLSANDFMTERMYESAYKLRGIYRGAILQAGSPRVDAQFTAVPREFREQLLTRGVAIGPGQQLVLYAPTWRGSFYSPVNDVRQLLERVRTLNRTLDQTRYRVLLKVHQVVYDFAATQPELRDVLIPNDLPTNVVLGSTDVLVTDYSSIFFDFLATGRPVLFHLPDEATYSDTRGLYLPVEQLPGPVSFSLGQLAGQLHQLGDGTDADALISHAKAYDAARQAYCPHEDGGATDRVIDVVFRGRTEGCDLRTDFSDGRTSILIHLGGMRSNGITKSALGLLENIDHDRFDVSAFYAHSTNDDRVRNETAIDPRVRLFPRLGGINGSKLLWFGRQLMLRGGLDAIPASQRDAQTRALDDEWVRCFGASEFDHIVDFSGYHPFWDYLLLRGRSRTHSVFLHNDLLADAHREVNGRRPHERNLRSVFAAYRRFDTLISVSPALSRINQAKLGTYAGSARFVSAPNTVNFRAILRAAYGLPPGLELFAPADRALRERPQEWPLGEGPAAPADVTNLPGAVETLIRRHSMPAVAAEVERRETIQRLVPPRPGVVTFVTAGRLSPEKNHARLIRAFDLVHREHPGTRLVILGNGPLAAELDALVVELGLVTAVTLAGHLDNPYAVMARSDCFVLSSDYEGQPMVLLEAMVLGLPIVTTDFASVRGALPEGYGLVVPMDVPALAAGMNQHLEGLVPAPVFDYVTYNHDAVQQFYRAIGAEADQSVPEPIHR